MLLLRRHLRWPEIIGQLFDGPSETEWRLVAVVNSRAGIAPDVEGFVDCHEHWNCVLNSLFGQLLAINCENTGPTLAGSRAVIFEVEHERVLAWLECTAKEVLADSATDATLPTESLQIKEIVNEDRLALLQEEPVAAKAAAHRCDHSLGTPFGNGNLGGDGVVFC